MCKKCNLPDSVNMQSLTAIRQKEIAALRQKEAQLLRFSTFEKALAECLLAKTRYETADRAYSARGETDSPEATEYWTALDLYKINALLCRHAALAYTDNGGAA